MDYRSGCVATIGFFDGVHVGHKFLIEELKTLAFKRNQSSMIITFVVHPRKVLNADFQPQLLNTPEEKTEQLESTQVDGIIELEFTIEMAQLTAYEFLNLILKHNFNVKTLLVGHDHRFGHNRSEGFQEYKKYIVDIIIEIFRKLILSWQQGRDSTFFCISLTEIAPKSFF